jgi:uncharacterized protein YciI
MWYLAMRRPVKPREEWTVSLDQHLVWMKQQHEAGTILFSGPTPDRKYGIYVIRAASKADAEKSPPPIPTRRRDFASLISMNGRCIRSWARGHSAPRNCRRTGERRAKERRHMKCQMKQSRWRSLWTWTLRGSLPNSKPETRNRLVMHGRSGIVILAAVVSIVGLWHARVEAQADWKKSWETVIQAARKEGEVTIYGPHNPVYQQVWAIFQKTYPEIKFSFVPSKGSDHAQRIVAERRAGKYLADVLMGGSSTYASFAPDTMAVINRAPHPNATKLFVNWVLSREGQTAWQKYTEVNSLRMDIPKTDLPPDDVPQKGVNYFMLNSSRYNGQAGRKALRKIVEDALKRAGKGG